MCIAYVSLHLFVCLWILSFSTFVMFQEDDPVLSNEQLMVVSMIVQQEQQRRVDGAMMMFGIYHDLCHYNKTKRHRGPESGHEWVLRNLSDPTYCFNMFIMNKTLFYQLHGTLVHSYGLTSSTKSSSVEVLGMFLWILGSPQSVRQTENRMGRSLDTVHRNFTKVLKCVVKLGEANIKPLDPEFKTIHPRL